MPSMLIKITFAFAGLTLFIIGGLIGYCKINGYHVGDRQRWVDQIPTLEYVSYENGVIFELDRPGHPRYIHFECTRDNFNELRNFIRTTNRVTHIQFESCIVLDRFGHLVSSNAMDYLNDDKPLPVTIFARLNQ